VKMKRDIERAKKAASESHRQRVDVSIRHGSQGIRNEWWARMRMRRG
jgi:hypothetical protein